MKNFLWLGLHAVLLLALTLFLTGATYERCYPAKARNVVDGDTVDVLIPFFNTALIDRVRLEGIDTPELSEEKGRQSADATRTWFTAAKDVNFCTSHKRDKYGRWLGDFIGFDLTEKKPKKVSLVQFLIANGFEKPEVEGKKPWWKLGKKK